MYTHKLNYDKINHMHSVEHMHAFNTSMYLIILTHKHEFNNSININ